MMANKFKLALLVATALAVLPTAKASADVLNVTYFSVAATPTTGDLDFNKTPQANWGTFSNEVQTALTNGMPVYNTSAAYVGPVLHDVDANGNLTWWNPAANSNVTQTGTATVTLPINNTAFFAPNNTGGGNGNGVFQTAIFSGTLNAPIAETVTFNFGADDDAFIVIDGIVVAQLGGIHSDTAGSVSAALTAGAHSLEIFYADRQTTEAKLNFSVTTEGVTVGVPEPSTWAMMVLGFAGVGFVAYRRKNKPVAFRIA